MDLQGKQAELKSSYDAARFQFISSELDLAITFCQIAESSEDRSKSERNAQHAQKAYQAATHFLNETELTKAQQQEIQDKIEQLSALLETLGNSSAPRARLPR